MAWLFARRMGCRVGHLCQPRYRRPMGGNRQGNFCQTPRRPYARNAGEEREGLKFTSSARGETTASGKTDEYDQKCWRDRPRQNRYADGAAVARAWLYCRRLRRNAGGDEG